jgi:hypothetical protein
LQFDVAVLQLGSHFVGVPITPMMVMFGYAAADAAIVAADAAVFAAAAPKPK